MTKKSNKKGFNCMRIKDNHGLIGGILLFALLVAMLASTLILCQMITGDMANDIEKLCKGEKDVDVIGVNDDSGVPVPDTNHLTQKTFNWTAGIMMSFMGLAILGIAFSYFTGIFNPEAAVKAKAMGMKLILAICIAPFLWIPLYYVIKINQTMCTSFIGMSGVDISTEWTAKFCNMGMYSLVPVFPLAIAGLAITVYAILIFRLIFIMITFATSPLAVILLVFPQTREFGGKLLKIFFESVFCLLFFDMSLIFCFKIIYNIGLNNPMGFALTIICLAAPLAIYKVLWNPISGAITGAMGSGVAAMTGAAAGGMGLGGAAAGFGGGGKGGMGAATAGAGVAGKGLGDVADKIAAAGGGMAQADRKGFGAPVGLAVAGGALAFKGGKKGVQAMAKRGREWKQDKKALSGKYASIDAGKPGAPASVVKEKHGPFAITRMGMQAKKMGFGEDFGKDRAGQKAHWAVQHGEDKKQQAFMGVTGRSAKDWELLHKDPMTLNKSEQRRQEQMQTDIQYGVAGVRLQKKCDKIDKGVTKKLGKLGVGPPSKYQPSISERLKGGKK